MRRLTKHDDAVEPFRQHRFAIEQVGCRSLDSHGAAFRRVPDVPEGNALRARSRTLRSLQLSLRARPRTRAYQTAAVYDFHVAGYEGETAKDHVDHIKAMAETLLPYLRERWSR